MAGLGCYFGIRQTSRAPRHSAWFLGYAMSRQLVGAAAIVVMFAGAAHAQVPGDSPGMGVGAAVANSRGLGIVSRSHTPDGAWSEYEADRSYRETVKRIPDKKPPKDPWGNIRQAPAASAADRHRVQ